ncbi:MAG: FAD-binding protein [Lachnospiraceae bacterium]|nr:FAD-binding protein [Lachnospiraceae bacterium]
MIRINQIKLPIDYTEEMLEKKVCRLLKAERKEILSIKIAKRSIDARKKPDIYYSIVVEVEAKKEGMLVKRAKSNQVTLAERVEYRFPESGEKPLGKRPVVIGSGPAGLFCAYMLAEHGYQPIVLERGEEVETRKQDVEEFWKSGVLKPNSNVQFGEGGAGTFSDGKLNTLIKDKDGKNKKVLSIFVEHGAPEKILYDGKPHIGTDILMTVVKNMRKQIEKWGGEFRFGNQVVDFEIQDEKLKALVVKNREEECYCLETEHAVLAIGHSARDTFETLLKREIPMEAKSFAVGLRVEHPQELIQISQYGDTAESLPAAAYKLTAKTSLERGVYSFCMCPGGYVVNASSEEGRTAVNGMSYSGRDGKNANSAIIVSVTPDDFHGEGPLAGIAFQRKLEEKAFEIGQGKVPVERYGDFKREVCEEGVKEESCHNEAVKETQSHACEKQLEKKESKVKNGEINKKVSESVWEDFSPQIKGEYEFTKVSDILPKELNMAFVEGMEQFDRIIPGFADDRVFLDGIESRTSSPVRINRDETNQSKVRGIYPCGEGAGYAGGITSAAMDGMKIAEGIAREYKPLYTNAN